MTSYRIIFGTTTAKYSKELLAGWLDKRDRTHTERSDGSWTVFGLTDEVATEFRAWVMILAAESTMSVYVPEPTAASAATTALDTTASVTWYQYQARVRGLTGHRISTDRLDTVVHFSEYEDQFVYCIQRVKYHETARRDVVDFTELELTAISREGKTWRVESIRTPASEQAPDSLNFGNVVTAREHWERVSAECVDTENTQIAALAILHRLKREVHN
jgi:hypothetical protein